MKKGVDKRIFICYNILTNKREGNKTMKTVYTVDYTTTKGNRTAMFYNARKAKAFGFRQMAKTGNNFTVVTTTEAQAMGLR